MKFPKLFSWRIAGTTVRIHPTFWVLLPLGLLGGRLMEILAVFGLVLMHETAHVLAARSFGAVTQSVELYPYGGSAIMEGDFEGKRWEESVIALAGPAFNFFCFLVLQVLRWQGWVSGDWALEWAKVNLWLAGFNCLPILPLDGGRVVRAQLAGVFGFVRVTRALAWLGRWTGVAFVILGLSLLVYPLAFPEPIMLIVLGIFLWIGCGDELKKARLIFLKTLCRKKELLLRRGLMRSICLTVNRKTPLGLVVDELAADRYSLISVTGARDHLEHTLSETEVIAALIEKGPDGLIGEIARRS
ncbi:MAG: M50 family metallopeptidase [Peptococcaceae bacterium]|nr:M50 family metallopeptidase [Peptococcaceae bacterium]